MTLAKQIDKWYQAGEHEETVRAILELAESEVTDTLTEDLAVAYNNLGQYQKAIHVPITPLAAFISICAMISTTLLVFYIFCFRFYDSFWMYSNADFSNTYEAL